MDLWCLILLIYPPCRVLHPLKEQADHLPAKKPAGQRHPGKCHELTHCVSTETKSVRFFI